MRTTRTPLNDGWRFREIPSDYASPACTLPWLPAQVPGHVHLDLIRAGVILDPFYRLAERGSAWVDHTDWTYESTFEVEAVPENAVLLFHGLDTLAEVSLNGEKIGESENMFISHEFPVNGKLNAGSNLLQVTFRAAVPEGVKRQKAWNEAGNPTLPFEWNAWNARSFVRKAQYMYGWDWGPEPVSCGIWKTVELVSIPVARLLDWQYEVEFAPEGSAFVRLETFVERAPNAKDTPLSLTFSLPSVGNHWEGSENTNIEPITVSVPDGEGRIGVSATMEVENPRRWTPVGHGEPENTALPYLYALEMTLHGEEVEDRKTGRIGLRTVELIQEPDADGQSFKFRVNGEDLFAKGANWIPSHSFPFLRCFPTARKSMILPEKGAGEAIRIA